MRQIGLAHPSLPNSFIVLSGAYLREETRPRLARSLRDRYFFPRHRDDVPHPFACLRIKLPGQERRGGTRGTGGDNVKRIDGRRGRWRGKNSPSAVPPSPHPAPLPSGEQLAGKCILIQFIANLGAPNGRDRERGNLPEQNANSRRSGESTASRCHYARVITREI